MATVSAKGISKSYDDTKVLSDIDLTAHNGEFVTLVGPSGCGKSTLLRIIAGLEFADDGQIFIDQQDMSLVRPADRNLAMVFQSYALYPHLTVAQNMMTPLKLRDLPKHARLPLIGPLFSKQRYQTLRSQVLHSAEVLKITHLLDRKPGQLSGGQRQRVALGRALVRNPEAFLMDEPLSNLDAALRVHMRSEIADLHRRLGTTFIYVTHDQAEALTMSDKMAVMDNGKILQFGTPEEIYNTPNSLTVARFIGSPPINVLPAQINADSKIMSLGIHFGDTNATPGSASIGLRADAVSIGHRGLPAKIVHRENLGHDIYLHTSLFESGEKLVVRTTPNTSLRVNQSVNLAFDSSKALAFNEAGDRIGLHQSSLQEAVL